MEQKFKREYSRLLFYHEIPAWQQENKYILSGYRPETGSVYRSFQSLFFVHNETISIYSHVLGAVFFLILPPIFWQNTDLAELDYLDFIVLSVYTSGVGICFVLSSFCHIVWNCTASWASYSMQLDYLGILVLMWSASIPSIYYGFYFDPVWQMRYWMLTSSLAIICGTATMDPRFSKPALRPYRTAMYVGFGLSAVVFAMHGLCLHGWEVQNRHMSLTWMMFMALSNCIGALVFVARVPERWIPYRFDILGGSHQIFHVMVMVAALIHLAGLLMAVKAVHQQQHYKVPS